MEQLSFHQTNGREHIVLHRRVGGCSGCDAHCSASEHATAPRALRSAAAPVLSPANRNTNIAREHRSRASLESIAVHGSLISSRPTPSRRSGLHVQAILPPRCRLRHHCASCDADAPHWCNLPSRTSWCPHSDTLLRLFRSTACWHPPCRSWSGHLALTRFSSHEDFPDVPVDLPRGPSSRSFFFAGMRNQPFRNTQHRGGCRARYRTDAARHYALRRGKRPRAAISTGGGARCAQD